MITEMLVTGLIAFLSSYIGFMFGYRAGRREERNSKWNRIGARNMESFIRNASHAGDNDPVSTGLHWK